MLEVFRDGERDLVSPGAPDHLHADREPLCRATRGNDNAGLARQRERLREMTGPRYGWKPLPDLIGEINRYLTGWEQYFRHGYPARTFHARRVHLR